jgi:hypothetical protein
VAAFDPERKWLLKDRDGFFRVCADISQTRSRRSIKAKIGSPLFYGVVGPLLQLAGILWMVHVLGWDVVWHALLPWGMIMAGGFIMLGAITHGARHREAGIDGRNH